MKKLLIIILLFPLVSLAQQGVIPGCTYTARPVPPVTTTDTVPSSFVFTDVTGATTSTVYTSDTVTIAGLTGTATIRITGGTYSKNGGGYVSSAGMITNGNTVAVRITSSASYSTAVNAVVTIGGVSDTYTVTTGVDPSILRAAKFDSINNDFSYVYWGKDAFQDRASTVPAVHGSDVLSIKEAKNRGHDFEFKNTNPANPITNGTQTSMFSVPGVGTRTYPAYDTAFGGSVTIFNGRDKEFEPNPQFPDIAVPIETWHITMTKGAIVFEFQTGGYGGSGYRRNTNGPLFQWAGQSNELTRANNGTSLVPETGKINVIHTAMHANDRMAVRLTSSAGDLVLRDSFLLVRQGWFTGPFYMRNPYVGSNGHPDNFELYGIMYFVGIMTPQKRLDNIRRIKELFPVGLPMNRPHCLPTITVSDNVGTGERTFTVIPNYNDGGTGSPIDLNASTVTLFYGDQDRAYSGGNWLDNQGEIRTTDANTLSITRTLANTLTTGAGIPSGRYTVPGNNNTLLGAHMDCVALNGKKHKIMPAPPAYNSPGF
jgi:hypothetical protein